MNKDARLIFEAYTQKIIINELDIGTEWAGGGEPEVKKKIGTAPGGGYLIGNIASSLNISKEEASDLLTAAIFPRLFKQKPAVINGKEVGYINPSKNEDQFRLQIKDAIKLALNDLKIKHPELKVPSSDALRGYTARVIANLGGFYRDYAVGGKGVVAPVKSVTTIKKAVKKAEPTAAPEQTPVSTEDTYVRGDARFIPEYQKIFAEMPDEITIPAGKDIYSAPEFISAVKDAIMQAHDPKTANDKEYVTDFIDTLKYKNSFVKSDLAKSGEGEGTGELPTIDSEGDTDPVDILRDLGTWDQARGFDDFDKYSSV
ncbi:hypothetical protein EBR43_02280 [bacterium]|nr:hypothetical protein [bacterium]